MLHPIRALDHVIDSYRDYLTTEFCARDPQLRQALEDALHRVSGGDAAARSGQVTLLVESLPGSVIDLTPGTAGTASASTASPESGEGSGPTDLFGNPLQTDLSGEVVTSRKGKKRGRRR